MTLRRRTFATGALAAATLPAHADLPPWIDAHTHVFVRGLAPAANAR